MGKRSNFERVELDFYPTPLEAVIPLLPHLPPNTKFVEPCAGDGRLIRHLQDNGHECVYACDIDPKGQKIERRDVLFFDTQLPVCDMIITNPVWDREPLHKMIDVFRLQADCWLLFDAGWMFTKQSADLMKFCKKIVAVGRVTWIEGTNQSGMEDCAWYCFTKNYAVTQFIGR
jgi:hypothetical protein